MMERHGYALFLGKHLGAVEKKVNDQHACTLHGDNISFFSWEIIIFSLAEPRSFLNSEDLTPLWLKLCG